MWIPRSCSSADPEPEPLLLEPPFPSHQWSCPQRVASGRSACIRLCARWKSGLFGFRSLLAPPLIRMLMRPLELWGSGKSLMPWARMHWDCLRALLKAWCCCGRARRGHQVLAGPLGGLEGGVVRVEPAGGPVRAARPATLYLDLPSSTGVGEIGHAVRPHALGERQRRRRTRRVRLPGRGCVRRRRRRRGRGRGSGTGDAWARRSARARCSYEGDAEQRRRDGHHAAALPAIRSGGGDRPGGNRSLVHSFDSFVLVLVHMASFGFLNAAGAPGSVELYDDRGFGSVAPDAAVVHQVGAQACAQADSQRRHS